MGTIKREESKREGRVRKPGVCYKCDFYFSNSDVGRMITHSLVSKRGVVGGRKSNQSNIMSSPS
jgi:hypothetical protein